MTTSECREGDGREEWEDSTKNLGHSRGMRSLGFFRFGGKNGNPSLVGVSAPVGLVVLLRETWQLDSMTNIFSKDGLPPSGHPSSRASEAETPSDQTLLACKRTRPV